MLIKLAKLYPYAYNFFWKRTQICISLGMSDKYFEQMSLDAEQKDMASTSQQNTGVDLGLHYVNPNNGEYNILPGGGSIQDWNLGNNNTILTSEIQNLKMQNELQKQMIELLRSEVTLMKERLDNYLKYERRRIGTTEVGDRDKTADGAEQPDTLQHIRHKGSS